MERFYDTQLQLIKSLAKGTTIVDIEHNEDADEGMILTLDTGTKLIFGWSSAEGDCDVALGNVNEILKLKL